MKRTIFTIAAVTLMTGAFFSSCQSAENKVGDARADVVDAKQELKAAVNDSVIAAVGKVNDAEWAAFREASELKIKNGELRIAELKKKIKMPGEKMDALYERKIDTLEQRNKNLQIRMDTYEKNQSDWESFKQEFNTDMEDLGHSLKNFVIKSKD